MRISVIWSAYAFCCWRTAPAKPNAPSTTSFGVACGRRPTPSSAPRSERSCAEDVPYALRLSGADAAEITGALTSAEFAIARNPATALQVLGELTLAQLGVAVDAAAPTNVAWLNPKVVKEAYDTGGVSLAKGAARFAEDMVRNGGRAR